jgi:chorismate dehydratase
MFKLGIVNFINTAAIYLPWNDLGPLKGWEVKEGPPSLLNKMLKERSLDAGLISSYAYGLNKDIYCLLPNLSISATGSVGSVLLFSKIPVHELHKKEIIVTSDSATSTALLKIILKKYYFIDPSYKTGTYEDFEYGAHAYLSIGNEALRISLSGSYPYVIDLADVWLKQTGLPFVFAVFALRKELWKDNPHAVQSLYERLIFCQKKGKNDLFSICKRAAPIIPMDDDSCLDYLKGIEHDFSLEKQKGLLHFFSMIKEMNVFPDVEHLEFVPIMA